MTPRPPTSTLFPYTTLFRSSHQARKPETLMPKISATAERRPSEPILPSAWKRSEEHTSELQSLRHLVCRLLLEKKKKKNITSNTKDQERILQTRPKRVSRRQ